MSCLDESPIMQEASLPLLFGDTEQQHDVRYGTPIKQQRCQPAGASPTAAAVMAEAGNLKQHARGSSSQACCYKPPAFAMSVGAVGEAQAGNEQQHNKQGHTRTSKDCCLQHQHSRVIRVAASARSAMHDNCWNAMRVAVHFIVDLVKL
jgi:hypothetical protein